MSRSLLEMGSPFRQGSTAAAQAAEESLPIFIVVVGALAAMAFVSPESGREARTSPPTHLTNRRRFDRLKALSSPLSK
jgi:hypothetical protein